MASHIELPVLDESEVNDCLRRGMGKLENRLAVGFMAELALAKYLEKRGISGSVAGCVIQQSRTEARHGADLRDIDVKTSECKTVEQAESYNLQASVRAVQDGPPKFAFVPFVAALGRHVFMGWATREELLAGQPTPKFDGLRLPVGSLRSPESYFEN